MYKAFSKRLIDLIVSILGILVLSPLVLIITFILFFSNNGRPFFTQLRPGKNEELFKIVKFKTMNDKKDEHGNLLPDKDRITKVGLFVRRTSLDEIPQLLNVISGSMSLVGPRPLLIHYLPLYSEEQKKRHLVKPGITGWAQVNGRNAISWQQKFEYDVWYVNHCSFFLDMKILWLTLVKVIQREGISSGTSATMEAFTGNESL
jgi:lipopolysaccharide/colanic/teichoic acid biosynthesis glycosyltransferase